MFRALILVVAALAAIDTPATRPGVNLSTGWSVIKEGQADGTVEPDAKRPPNDDPHLLRISLTKLAPRGRGRFGAKCDTPISVQQEGWYDVSFTAVTERGSIGLVFSLETDDGTVLARTTLPEIGRGARGRRGAATAPANAPWTKYLVSLHASGASGAAHLTISPIEPTNVWLDGLTLTPRQ